MTRQQTTRPPAYRDAHAMYLEVLRASGQINMFGAAPHLAAAFDLPKREARQIVEYWAASYAVDAEQVGGDHVSPAQPPDRDDPGVRDHAEAMRQHEATR